MAEYGRLRSGRDDPFSSPVVARRATDTAVGWHSTADCVPRGHPCVHWVPGSPGWWHRRQTKREDAVVFIPRGCPRRGDEGVHATRHDVAIGVGRVGQTVATQDAVGTVVVEGEVVPPWVKLVRLPIGS